MILRSEKNRLRPVFLLRRNNLITVGASALARVVNHDAGNLTPRGALSSIASRLAPTGGTCSGQFLQARFENIQPFLQHRGLGGQRCQQPNDMA
ncbi:hypothetical protein C1890_19760 [Pseudomonas sp. DP16D-R1]|nr:hypothetical protein C1890_19760 [Pseudomonas sp. DP16D-R1]